MTIELKYKIGSIVWYMSNNQAISNKVINWNISGNNGGEIIKTYYLQAKNNDNVRQEAQLYPTKEELLKSL